jgi:hypothetical protein
MKITMKNQAAKEILSIILGILGVLTLVFISFKIGSR